MNFLFIETSVFNRSRHDLMRDDELHEFQVWLLQNYELGDTIAGTSGCKKVRWSRPGTGKSGGVRVIYYVQTQRDRIYLLIMYPKSRQDNLSDGQKSQLKGVIQQINQCSL
ncbi:MAG TPA: type II toxin-antitoxin system RelE/ParE family toxin [Scandinavium sp.]|jgi:hypothetical protein|uniref:type II toxin-antitoxin system RelE/ParE family toxin n=1 Tax=Scandinavium sp. TaxID=2830653 RepID=UPI002E35E43A|nr:type II toxin-antitoxin system RelE/ParE family toxin [Scandinavium sp.]HEX4502669.1 type II toxin-antitoxin system RelE/ParE family toxin [Scandinavium sp.]